MIKYKFKVYWDNLRVSETPIQEAADYSKIAENVFKVLNSTEHGTSVKQFIIDIIHDKHR